MECERPTTFGMESLTQRRTQSGPFFFKKGAESSLPPPSYAPVTEYNMSNLFRQTTKPKIYRTLRAGVWLAAYKKKKCRWAKPVYFFQIRALFQFSKKVTSSVSASSSSCVPALQRCIKDLDTHLWWSFFAKAISVNLRAIKYSCKKTPS